MNLIKEKGFDFAFDRDACQYCNGRCCRGEPGYIFVNSEEIEAISRFLQLPADDFIKQYVRKAGYRLSLREYEKKGEFFCCFFDEDKSCCSIYGVRPLQCSSFPFWERFKTDSNDPDLTRCPGVVFVQGKRE